MQHRFMIMVDAPDHVTQQQIIDGLMKTDEFPVSDKDKAEIIAVGRIEIQTHKVGES